MHKCSLPLLLLLGSDLARAQAEPRTKTVVAGEQFRAGGLHRFLFGRNYRDLWTTPVELPVLDLQTFAGGLTVVRRLGHGQTKALALAGADGVAYTFRPVLKDPVNLLPVELRETLAARIVRDQMSSQHPGAHVVVPVLAEALGLLHNTPRLFVMPDDAALGEFRDDFKDLVGDLEEFTGQKGYGGAQEIIDGAEMWKRLDQSPATRVDARVYLRARLLDHLLGDWDRHREQWRWARIEGQPAWQPIPEDRDQAFVRFQGFALSFLRPGLPLLVDFGPKMSSLDGLTFDSWDVDRRLLTELTRADFEAAAADVQARLTDDVLTRAVGQLPKAWHARVGADLLAGLEARRQALPRHAQRYYRYLARQVDVRGTAQAERAELQRFDNGDVELSLRVGDEPPYYRRRFEKKDTDEVRLYLREGDDQFTSRGPRGGITVRVVGASGNDRVDDSAVGGVRVSDAEGQNQVQAGPGTHWDQKRYQQPPPNPRGGWIPARDWGRRTIAPLFRFTGSPDLGLVANVLYTTTGYGFRKDPWADKQTWKASYSTKHQDFAGSYEGRFRFENSANWLDINARASGFEIVRFYGFGNETASSKDDDLFRVNQDQFSFSPSLGFALGKRTELSFGPLLKYAVTETDTSTVLGALQPYGIQDFGQLGAAAGLEFDSTDRAGLPTRGVRLSLGGAAYPAVWTVTETFGELHADAALYLTKGPTLVLRGGAKRVFGTYPFHEAAYLGGAQSLRGLRVQRYAGDAVLYGGAELHVPVAKVFLFAPGELGVMGLADFGRVYLDGESSKRWHHGFGGGLYFVSPKRNNAFAVSMASSEGRRGFYFRVGVGF